MGNPLEDAKCPGERAAHSRLHGPEFTRPAYRSDLEPISLREARAPLIEVPANLNPVHDSQPERIVCQPPVAAPISPAEAVDLEQQPADDPLEQADVPLVSAFEEPILVTPVDVLPEYEIEDGLSELDPSQLNSPQAR